MLQLLDIVWRYHSNARIPANVCEQIYLSVDLIEDGRAHPEITRAQLWFLNRLRSTLKIHLSFCSVHCGYEGRCYVIGDTLTGIRGHTFLGDAYKAARFCMGAPSKDWKHRPARVCDHREQAFRGFVRDKRRREVSRGHRCGIDMLPLG